MKHCRKGHEQTEANTYQNGKYRRCRVCYNANAREKYVKKASTKKPPEPELTLEQKKKVYPPAIMRMLKAGLITTERAKEMLDRVGALT